MADQGSYYVPEQSKLPLGAALGMGTMGFGAAMWVIDGQSATVFFVGLAFAFGRLPPTHENIHGAGESDNAISTFSCNEKACRVWTSQKIAPQHFPPANPILCRTNSSSRKLKTEMHVLCLINKRCNVRKLRASLREPDKPARTTSRRTTDKSQRSPSICARRAHDSIESRKQDKQMLGRD